MSTATKKAIVNKVKAIKESFVECAELIDEVVQSGRL